MGNSRTSTAVFAFGLMSALAFAAYFNSFDSGFHFDDIHQIIKNQGIRGLSNAHRFFSETGLASYAPELKGGYRPVTFVSFALNYALSGYNAWGYHVLNFILHALNAAMVYLIAGHVLRRQGYDGGDHLPLVAALAFALHPVQTGAVTYVSGRAVLLASLFGLLAIYCFLRHRAGRGPALPWSWLAPLFFLLALFSKEMAAGTLAVMIAYDLIFTLPEKGGVRKAWREGLYYLPMVAALGVYLVLRKSVAGYLTVQSRQYGLLEYLMSQGKALLLYLRLLALPVNQNADYNLALTRTVDARVALSAVLVAALVWLLYKARKKRPALTFFGAWFFLALAPESSFVPIPDIAVEYRLYLPSIGFITAATLMAAGLVRSPAFRKGFSVFILCLFFVLTINRNTVWASERALWADVLKKSPGSPRAHLNLGQALLAEKRYHEAIGEFNRSLALNPYFDQAYSVYNNRGASFLELGMYDYALSDFKKAVGLYQDCIEAYVNMGVAYYRTGRYGESAEALTEALRHDPAYADAHYYLALTYTKLGRTEDALREAEEAKR